MCSRKRQYQRRISQWHLDKNVKDSEMRHIAKKQKTRKLLENKDTAFRVRGRAVDPDKITRTVKRKNISDDTLISAASPLARKYTFLATQAGIDFNPLGNSYAFRYQLLHAPSHGPFDPAFAM